MLYRSLIAAALENSLNRLLFRDKSLQAARQRLVGKTLQLQLQEFPSPLTLLFHARQVDVVNQWAGTVDCTLITGLTTLLQLRDRQRLVDLIRTRELAVEGDIQVVQQLVAVFDLVEWDLAEWLAPYVGDIAAEGIGRILSKGTVYLRQRWQRDHAYLSTALIEEWRLAPGALEMAWFGQQVDEIYRHLEAFEIRLSRMEKP